MRYHLPHVYKGMTNLSHGTYVVNNTLSSLEFHSLPDCFGLLILHQQNPVRLQSTGFASCILRPSDRFLGIPFIHPFDKDIT